MVCRQKRKKELDWQQIYQKEGKKEDPSGAAIS